MIAAAAARVLIVDDHPLVNHGLAAIIDDERGLTVCGRAASMDEARELFAATRPDLVILDILLPDGGDGFDLLSDFQETNESAKILVFSSLDPDVYASKAYSLGAAGYVHKSMVISEIVPAIRAALEEAER